MYKFMLSRIISYPKKRTEYVKILPRRRTDGFRKLARKGHNH